MRHDDSALVRGEIDELRLDLALLRALIDAALDRGIRGDDFLLKACADAMYDRKSQLERLEGRRTA